MTVKNEELIDLTKAFGLDTAAKVEAYKKLQNFAKLLNSEVNRIFDELGTREHTIMAEALTDLGRLGAQVKRFTIQVRLSSKFSRDRDIQVALDDMQKMVDSCRLDANRISMLFMNEMKSGG